MFCVVEGPDNSGKSTLASFLARELKTHLVHSGGPGKDKIEFMARVNRLTDYPSPVIFDRFPVISEHVYAPVIRNTDTFDGTVHMHRLRLMARNPIIIYCRPPMPILMDLKDHPVKSEHEDADHVARVVRNGLALVQRYDEVMTTDYPDALHYDYTAGGDQFRRLLLQFLQTRM